MKRNHPESNHRLSRVGRSYAADQPSGKSASAVQVSGTTQWTTDHNLVLHQDGHVVYRTTGQDKTTLTGSDTIWFEYQAGKIGGERTMTGANTESHNLTIDGTGSGVGSGGWSGDWKYHYQSEDLVDDTDTKKFAWTDGKWSQTDHTFRTDHKKGGVVTDGPPQTAILPILSDWEVECGFPANLPIPKESKTIAGG